MIADVLVPARTKIAVKLLTYIPLNMLHTRVRIFHMVTYSRKSLPKVIQKIRTVPKYVLNAHRSSSEMIYLYTLRTLHDTVYTEHSSVLQDSANARRRGATTSAQSSVKF